MTAAISSGSQPLHLDTIKTTFGEPGVALAHKINAALKPLGMVLEPIPGSRRFTVLNSKLHQLEEVSKVLNLLGKTFPLSAQLSKFSEKGEITIKFEPPAPVTILPPAEHY